uniref:CCHC-type domain-containing protein n=1 Tax=Tanacetum cinerariifolium TaxID=118510 RepID=A0A699HC07_TANCI|nr:hypothetical protein [Tanacetum cinerariifolium]
MAAGQKKPAAQWTADEKKAANLDQRLKSLIMFSNAKATDQNKCHKCGKKGHFARDCWSNTSIPLYQSPFQPKLLHSSENKPEIRNTKDFEAKYNKVKAKLALFSSSASAPSSFSSKNKCLIAELYYWDKEEVSSNDEETEVKALMAFTNEERTSVGKESARNGEWTKITIKKDNSDMSITSSNLHKSSEAEDYTLPNHNTDEVPSKKSQKNTTDPSVVVSNSLAFDYDLADESSVCGTPLLLLKKLDGAEPSSRPKTVN